MVIAVVEKRCQFEVSFLGLHKESKLINISKKSIKIKQCPWAEPSI